MNAKANLFVIGAAKSGTSSIHGLLATLPGVFMSAVKEPHYFSRVQPTGKFRGIIPVVHDDRTYQQLFRSAGSSIFRGESSTSYLWSRDALGRIHAYDGTARIVVSLRDPIERAYSHYLNDVREGAERRPVGQALREDFALPSKQWGQAHLYVDLGNYGPQLDNVFRLFDRSQVLILEFDELIADVAGVRAKLGDFLGIQSPGEFDPESIRSNPYGTAWLPGTKALLGSGTAREIYRALAPGGVRTFVRNHLLFRHATKPILDSATEEWLRTVYKYVATDVERLSGRAPSWAQKYA